MAFGLTKEELNNWKKQVHANKIAIITHYWRDDRFPEATSVTKIGCANLDKLIKWGKKYGLKAEWIDYKENYPHFDVFGRKQVEILVDEKKFDQIKKFNLKTHN